MTTITFGINDFILSNDIHQYSNQEFSDKISCTPKQFEIVQKYFGDRTQVEILTTSIAIHEYCGDFSLLDDLVKLLETKGLKKKDYEKYYDSFSSNNTELVEWRTNELLIESIKEIGSAKLLKNGRTIGLKTIPKNFKKCTEIREYSGRESLHFTFDSLIEEIICAPNLNSHEKIEKITELSFINIIFKKCSDINNDFRKT